MKPRIYKSGKYWVVQIQSTRWVCFLFETALAHALQGMYGVDPVPHYIATQLEPTHA